MNDEFTKKLPILQSEQLTPEERASLRSHVVLFMQQHPAQAISSRSFFVSAVRMHRRRIAVGGALAVFLLSGGVSFAAEGALPGDILYPIKVHVNEGVARVLARTPDAKATIAEGEVARRASETEALVQTERLDDDARIELVGNTKQALEDFKEAKRELEKTGKIKEVKQHEERLNKTLDQHRVSLSNIGITADVVQGHVSSDDEEKIERPRSASRSEQVTSSTTPRIERSEGRSGKGVVSTTPLLPTTLVSPGILEQKDDDRTVDEPEHQERSGHDERDDE